MKALMVEGLWCRVSAWPLVGYRPTLVMLHGSGNTGVLWDGQVAGLGDVANVVAVDLAGHGRSALPLARSVEAHAESVVGVIEALGVSSAVVCGLSLGGAIALQMLLDHGDVLAGGVLVGTGARLRVMPMIFEAIEGDFEGFVAGMPSTGASSKTDPALIGPLQAAALENGAEVMFRDFSLCDTFDVMSRLPEIALPVLVVSGEDDVLTPPKYAGYMAAQIPGAELVSMSDAGHLAPVEKPEVVNRAISAWLSKL